VAELALFGLPSVLIPLPDSANDHQAHNAQEFVNMNAATLLPQREASPERIAESLSGWLDDSVLRQTARMNLAAWDVPDSAGQILALIREAAK